MANAGSLMNQMIEGKQHSFTNHCHDEYLYFEAFGCITGYINFKIHFRWEQHKKAFVDVKKSDNLSVETIQEGVEKVRM